MANEIPFTCPRAKSPHHPCVVHHGKDACDDEGRCVWCNIHPADELRALVPKYIELKERKDRT